MCAPLTGLIANAPVATPVLGASAASAVRSRSLRVATPSQYAVTAARCADVVMRATSGCSGASTTYVPPNSVSGRVVNTEIASPVPTTVNVALAPIDLPIQSRCILSVPAGQSRPSSSSTSRSAYAVMRSIHCVISRFSTGSPVSMYLPSWTSSFASTVPSAGQKFTGTSARYASPRSNRSSKIHCVHL